MKRIKTLLASALLAASSVASAGVVYTWETLVPSESIYHVAGFIELSDAAVAAGSVNYQARTCADFPCDLSDPSSPILRFSFNVNRGASSAIDISPLSGDGYFFENPTFDASFRIVGNELVFTTLNVNTLFSTLWMSGQHIDRFTSDAGPCLTWCAAAEGRFVTAATQVPEPGSLALFGLAIAGAGLVRRQRRAAPQRHAA